MPVIYMAGIFICLLESLKIPVNRQVKRNIQRFPLDFMFRLTKQERDELVPIWHQFQKAKHSYVLPYAFTEYGVTMLASVLRSERAIKMSIAIVRAFVKLREIMSAHKEIVFKLKELEAKIGEHDIDIRDIFEAIRQLMRLPDEKRRIAGFKAK